MARIHYSGLVNRIAGKLEGGIFGSWKGKGTVKSHVKGLHQPRSSQQQMMRGLINDYTGRWYSLPDTQKRMWEAYAAASEKRVTAHNAYIGKNIYAQRYFPGHAEITSPPFTPSTPTHPIGFGVAQGDAANFSITWTSPTLTTLFVVMDYWPMPGRAKATNPQWKFGATSGADALSLSLSTDYPENTVMSFRVRSIDQQMRVSPWSHTKELSLLDLHVYVADTINARIVKRLKSDLSYVAKIGSFGTGNDGFNSPSGISADDTYVYVADTGNSRIVKRLKSDLSYVAKIGSAGSGNDQFSVPRGITVDDTHVYVADTGNSRIMKRLKSDLSYVAKIGSAGSGNDQFSSPSGIGTRTRFA